MYRGCDILFQEILYVLRTVVLEELKYYVIMLGNNESLNIFLRGKILEWEIRFENYYKFHVHVTGWILPIL